MPETQERERAKPETGGPRIAHFEDPFGPEPLVALCGAKMLGIEAPPGAEKCVVCLDLFDGRFGA